MNIKVMHLYSNIMNLYADTGNIKALKYRLEKRGVKLIYDTYNIGDKITDKNYFSNYDLIFMGGGSDIEQENVSKDLEKIKDYLKVALDEKIFFLLVCGGYQLFGKYYINSENKKINGLGFFDYYTKSSNKRMIGDIYVETLPKIKDESNNTFKVLGFENHSGETFFEDEKENNFFGKIIFGYGNTYNTKYEGFFNGNVLGTYIHGPLLPKNPKLTDFIIRTILSKKYLKENSNLIFSSKGILIKNNTISLIKLNDTIEENALMEQLKNLNYL